MKMSALTHSMNYALLHTQYAKTCFRKHFYFKNDADNSTMMRITSAGAINDCDREN